MRATSTIPSHSSWARVVWASNATGALGVELECADVALTLDEADRLGSDGHRPYGLFVACMTDIKDRVALPGAHLELVVDLGHQGTAGVDDDAPVRAGGALDLGGGAVSREHDGRKGRDLVDVVHEHDALTAEFLDDEAVVDDLVVAVDGRLEHAHHPRQSLDGHLHARAEAARLCEQDELDVAGLVFGELISSRGHSRPG